jgi:hypothetical protein
MKHVAYMELHSCVGQNLTFIYWTLQTRHWSPSSLLYFSFNKQFTKRHGVEVNTSALYLDKSGVQNFVEVYCFDPQFLKVGDGIVLHISSLPLPSTFFLTHLPYLISQNTATWIFLLIINVFEYCERNGL